MRDFPDAPTLGQKFPASPQAGVPTYTWDGEKWTTMPGLIGKTPVYTDGSTAMTAQLTVVNPPVAPTNAAAMAYVDAGDATQVNFTPQTLTDDTATKGQKSQVRTNIYAAPFDAMMFNGMQVNGTAEVNQENPAQAVSLPIVGTNVFVTDCWVAQAAGTGLVMSAQQVVDAPPGFAASNKLTVTTAKASLAADDFASMYNLIEGVRTGRMAWGTVAAQPVSIGFWCKAHRPGTYSGSVQNGTTSRFYAFMWTQIAADAWEYKTITIPGDVSGAWINSQGGAGMYFTFTMACGPAYSGAPNVWSNGNKFAVSGTINGVAATTDTFQITGLVVLPGLELPSAGRSPFVARSFDQELALCQRYYNKVRGVGPGGGGPLYLLGYSSGGIWVSRSVWFPTKMRAVPSVALYGTWTYVNAGAIIAENITEDGLLIYVNGIAAGQAMAYPSNDQSGLVLNCRLY